MEILAELKSPAFVVFLGIVVNMNHDFFYKCGVAVRSLYFAQKLLILIKWNWLLNLNGLHVFQAIPSHRPRNVMTVNKPH